MPHPASPAALTYWPVALFILVALVLGAATLVVGVFFRPRKPGREKSVPYECGLDPAGRTDGPLLPRYYFLAMMMVLFDVEAVFLIPWALRARELGFAGLGAVALFFAVLAVGYAYVWRRGDLDWVRR